MQIYEFIKPLGILAYFLMFMTALSGFLRWKFKYHKMLAYTTVLLATIHFVVILIANR